MMKLPKKIWLAIVNGKVGDYCYENLDIHYTKKSLNEQVLALKPNERIRVKAYTREDP
jgi:hypothetical protein